MTEQILFEQNKHIGFITLNRPEALNAINLPMIKALQKQLSLWQEDKTIHAVILKAAGEKAFCAGGDVRFLYEAKEHKENAQLDFFWQEYRLNYFIHQFKKPYIALMDGITMGGGVGISLHGSHPIATEKFSFAMPETSIGLFPDIGASYLLAKCPDKVGLYLGLTGKRIDAYDAKAVNLVKSIIASENVSILIDNLIHTDLSSDPFKAVDACIREYELAKKEAQIETRLKAIDTCFLGDRMEEILIALAKYDDEWANQTLDILEAKSPLSLKVTLEQLHRAKTMSLAECLTMDYRLVNHFMQDKDFYEGIRALLIDKDKTPHWQPRNLSQVSPEKVSSYFEMNGLELILE